MYSYLCYVLIATYACIKVLFVAMYCLLLREVIIAIQLVLATRQLSIAMYIAIAYKAMIRHSHFKSKPKLCCFISINYIKCLV